MQTNYHLIFNRSVAANVLNIDVKKVIRVERWLHCCWVLFDDGCRFVSFMAFKCAFVEARKLAGKRLHNDKKVVRTNENLYLVESEKFPTFSYSIDLNNNSCTCQDYINQFAKFGRGRCKHIYAALESAVCL
jgi:hypothetical protein